MKKLTISLIITLLIIGSAYSGDQPTPLQILFTVKKIFPDAGEVNLFIAKDQLTTEQDKITRAAVQSKLKVKLFPIESATDIGKNIKELKDESILVLINSDMMSQNSTKLYILSKCKEKKIPLVTSSLDYSDSGALIGIIKEGTGTRVVINLKHYEYLRGKFTDEFVQSAGIASIVQ